MSAPPMNAFTDGPLGAIYLKTAMPIIFVMSVSGLLSVADALFLGHYVGPEALAAVTLIFPIFMLIVALSTLVSSGMSSLLARHLGGARFDQARGVFAGAHGLALAMSGVMIGLFLFSGPGLTLMLADGSADLARMGQVYLTITVLFTPLMFVLSVNVDALRNEGRVGFMAGMSLLVSLANIGFNYVLIAWLEMGVAGSAYGTGAAQSLALVIILMFRLRGNTRLRPDALSMRALFGFWRPILALGAPQSLNFLGLALGSAVIIASLQWVGSPQYEQTVSAYGIITRVLTFTFLPLLGLAFAMQTITGNNFGAALWHRSDDSLRIALAVALVYCLVVQIVLMAAPGLIARAFVSDPAVIAEVARILPVVSSVFFLMGPLMMIASYFQAIGSAKRAALLGLSKPYLFAIPLTLSLPLWFGEAGIWYAGPLAELMLLATTILVLARAAQAEGLRWGIFQVQREGRS